MTRKTRKRHQEEEREHQLQSEMKETFGSIEADPTSAVPEVLSAFCQGHELVDINKAFISAVELQTKEEADLFVDRFCGNLLEGIAVSHKGLWIYTTQAEAYMRGARHIGDCSNTTITINHPAKAKSVLEHKCEFQNQWIKAKLYLKNFDFLVTGCLCESTFSKKTQHSKLVKDAFNVLRFGICRLSFKRKD